MVIDNMGVVNNMGGLGMAGGMAADAFAEAAVLEVIDFNPAELNERGNLNVGKTGDSLLSGVSDALSGVKNAAKTAGKVMDAVTGKNVKGVEEGVLKMQFNPSSLKFSGSASNSMSQYDDPQINQIPSKGKIDFSCDFVIYEDTLSSETVAERMEFLLKYVMFTPYKKVKFTWGKLVVTGKISSLNSSYEMFDKTGAPVMGKISMTMKTDLDTKEFDKMIQEIGKEKADE